MSAIISSSKVLKLPFYKRGVEYLLDKNSRLIGLMLARLGKQIVHCPPDYVKIETTNACNGRCVYCPRDKMNREVGIMDLILFRKIIDEVAAWKVPNIHLQNFGEPLLDPHIINRIKYIKTKGIKSVNLFTNGMLLSKTMIDNLIEVGLDEINISIDVCNRQKHDSLRRNLSYDTIISNLKDLIASRKNINSPLPKISLASIIHSENKREVAEFINRWSGLVEEIHLQGKHDWALKDSAAYRPGFPCQRLWLTLTVLWDGRVCICCVDYDGKYILGDLKESTLKKIWNSEGYCRLRLLHLKTMDYQIDICKKCTLRLKDSPLWIKTIL